MSLRLTVKDYHNQDFIFKDTTFYKSIGDSLTINLGIDSNLQSNVYKWFRNQALYKTIIGSNKLIFNDLRQSDTGIYTCKVTNTGAPLLTLTSRNIKLNVGCNFTQIEQQKYICENSFYTLSNGKKVNEAGTYRDTISCGTILILHLSIARKDTTRLSRITCNPNIIGIKDTLLKNRFECDSLVRTTFTYVPIVTRLRDSIVCLAKDTQTITRKELSFQGCDSTVIRTLRLQRDTILTNTFICDTVNQRIETTLVSNRDGCQSMVQTQYRFEPCECLKTTTIYNALISNDNDQKNDVFFIQNIENFQPNELIITDKRNEFIYRVSNYNNDWKGTNLQGISLPAGTYNYVFRMTQTACLRVGAVDLKYD